MTWKEIKEKIIKNTDSCDIEDTTNALYEFRKKLACHLTMEPLAITGDHIFKALQKATPNTVEKVWWSIISRPQG
jgi:hypothetical protein